MIITGAKIYLLHIPFHFSFNHSLHKRQFSDSIVVELSTNTGERGFGEGIARPYVTGETVRGAISHIRDTLLPLVMDSSLTKELATTPPSLILSRINELLLIPGDNDSNVWHGARCAVELALVDLFFTSKQRSLGDLLTPIADRVTYSGVIPSGSIDTAISFAKMVKKAGIVQVKLKVEGFNDLEKVKRVREILGLSVSLRLDANGAFLAEEALTFIDSVAPFSIDSIEQPVKKGNLAELIHVKSKSIIPVMVDESLVTLDDAKLLVESDGCDYFNLRISKCGGIYNTLAIAEYALNNRISCQLGCQVGETAILSAAGRHLACCLPDLLFVEGSYGRLLLTEDISREDISFGKKGEALPLEGNGLGVEIDTSILVRYAKEIFSM